VLRAARPGEGVYVGNRDQHLGLATRQGVGGRDRVEVAGVVVAGWTPGQPPQAGPGGSPRGADSVMGPELRDRRRVTLRAQVALEPRPFA